MRNYEKEKKETKSKILHAFWEIYRTTRIEKITVKQITEACGIYRTTFYLHYSDVYAILENLEKDLLDEITAVKDEISAETEGTKEAFFHLYEVCRKQKDYLTVLVLNQKSNFAVCYRQELMSVFGQIYDIPKNNMENPVDQIMMHALAEAFLGWIDQDTLGFETIYQAFESYMKRGILATILQK